MKYFNKKGIFYNLIAISLSAIITSSVFIATSCSTTAPVNNKFSHAIPTNTVYQTIHDLEYSLLIVNNDNKATFGTGWMFDFQFNNNNKDVTFYLGTNLHVADALHNSEDKMDLSGLVTKLFYLGKYDNGINSDLSSIKFQKDVTYCKLNTLPKTQFVGTNVVTSKFSSSYIDFAVFAVTLSITDPIYTNWISNSINRLKQIVGNISYSSYVDKLFPIQDVSKNNLSNLKAYVAGYPYYDDKNAFFYQTQSILSSPGSACWTINEPLNDKQNPVNPNYEGQNFDLSQTANKKPYGFKMVLPGIYISEELKNWSISYHGLQYNQSGVGYVIDNSNISEGSSGSLLMNQNNEIMGIYYGTFSYSDKNIESPFGLSQILRFNDSTNKLLVNSYDLIAGQQNSYKSSLNNAKTWLFYGI
ncbi:DUF31 family putative serine protease [Mycoplasmoides alvi]|uniref:DUF31 family putative serine protease n=1 Tax=Mycoplasmoides alvi TaxID=78580 RepID=UPI00051C0FA4|nr:hypothetical protein [Mycoplasmoides alvi]